MVTRLKRYNQIAKVLVKYGFGIILDQLYPEVSRPDFLRKKSEHEESIVYTRIRMAIEELGPTFVKLGQMMSTRRELFPPPLIEELLKLTDDVPALPFQKVKTVIEEICGPISETFQSFEEDAFAGASLSQVHRATLMDGSTVAVKVQRPGIREIIEVDLKILESMAERIETTFQHLRMYNPIGIVQEFSVQIRKELDFVRDGKNADRISKNMKNISGVRVPKIIWEYSGSRVLVMEYIKGVRVDDVDAIRELGIDLKEISEKGFAAYLNQILVDGFFHGDPHPGNLMVTPDGELVLLDFGNVGIIRPDRRDEFMRVLYAIVNSDVELFLGAFDGLGVSIREEDVDPLKDELYVILQETRAYELGQYDIEESMREISGILYRYRIQVPANLMLMMKVIIMVEGIGVKLDPEFNFISRVEPYLDEIVADQLLSPERIERASRKVASDVLGLSQALNESLKRLAEGRLRVEMSDPELKRVEQSIDRASYTLLLGMLVAAIIIGLSLVVALETPLSGWLLYGVIAGSGFAALMVVYALRSMGR
jgi:ubiquinone biosynthesis protein